MEQKKHQFTSPNGDRYVGSVDENGLPHGTGTMIYAERPYVSWMESQVAFRSYKGEWQHGKRSGMGRMEYQANGNGSTEYRGQWCDDLPHGQGVFEHHGNVTSTRYEGEWRAGVRHGQGTYSNHWDKGTFAAEEYVGSWENDQRCGWGTSTRRTARGPVQYIGEWRGDLRHGTGTLLYANGDRYEGAWEKDEKQGEGTCSLVRGQRFSAQWNNNHPDMATLRMEEGSDLPVLRLSLLASGFDYTREAVCLLFAEPGDYALQDTFEYNPPIGKSCYPEEDPLLSIKRVGPGEVELVVSGTFTQSGSPALVRIQSGETLEYQYRIQCTDTIYDEDYDYEIIRKMILTCS